LKSKKTIVGRALKQKMRPADLYGFDVGLGGKETA